MAIEGKSLDEVARLFCDQVNRLLNATVTQARSTLLEGPREGLVMLSLREAVGEPGAPLRTKYGTLRLIVGQHLSSEKTSRRRHKLKTVKYAYRIAEEGARDALLRWEYASEAEHGDRPFCRHHGHALAELGLSKGVLSLDEVHIPTGYVSLEDVLRFCIVDLGVAPLRDDWHERLRESARDFRRNL
jgi:hypothetical protein